jgi:hypothetical protein
MLFVNNIGDVVHSVVDRFGVKKILKKFPEKNNK